MKIGILQTIHPPYDKRVYWKEAVSLAQAGHEVVLFQPTEIDLPEAQDGCRFVPLPWDASIRGRLRTTWRLIGVGRRERCDVYMAVEPESWVSGLAIKLTTGRPIVFDVHEYFPTLFAKFFPRALGAPVTWLTRFMMRVFARFTDEIVLTKASLDDDFKCIRVRRTVVLNTNHLQPRCTEIPEALRARYAERPTLIHQGIFGTYRGAYELLEAMKLLVREAPDIHCICLGRYEYGTKDEYLAALRESGMDACIEVIDEVPFTEVPAWMAVSRIGLILFQPVGLEHTYGMPHKMFDYMREGLPIVGPDYAVEIARVIREADCGLLIDVTDPEAIAAAILRLLRDPEEAQRLGANGRRAVETTYNWQHEEKKLLAVFDRIAERQATA